MSRYEEDWFGPQTGLLAPRNTGGPTEEQLQRFFDSPNLPRPPRSQNMPPAPSPELEKALRENIDRYTKMYPFGTGYAEGDVIPTPGNTTAGHINSQIQGRHIGPEDINDPIYPKQPMPPEFEPERPIPLGEIQRRWGVPRLEEL